MAFMSIRISFVFFNDQSLQVLSSPVDRRYLQSCERSMDLTMSLWQLKTGPGLSRAFESKYWMTLSAEATAKCWPSSLNLIWVIALGRSLLKDRKHYKKTNSINTVAHIGIEYPIQITHYHCLFVWKTQRSWRRSEIYLDWIYLSDIL